MSQQAVHKLPQSFKWLSNPNEDGTLLHNHNSYLTNYESHHTIQLAESKDITLH